MTEPEPSSVQPVASAKNGAMARAVGLGLAFAATVTSLALPIGVGYIVYQRWIAGHSLQEASLHLEDALLLLQAVASLLVLAAAFAWVAIFQRRLDRQGDFRALGFGRAPRNWLMLGAGVLGGVLSAAVPIGLALASGELAFGASHAALEGAGDVVLDALGSAVILAGLIVAEELVFRGYMMWTLDRAGWPVVPSILIPALLFSLYRLVLAPASWAAYLNVLAAGILLGLLTRRTRSLPVAIGARLGWALSIGMLFSMPVGGSPVEGILTSVPVPGLALDRAFGPEGSWLLLLLLVVGIVTAWVSQRGTRPS
jgi:membrane protease YdiL (CAAX protease family)